MIALALSDLPALNALLNASSALCVLTALHRIKRGRIDAHRRWMLAAVGLSTLFLVSYLVYHGSGQSRSFEAEGWLRTAYLSMLASHVVLAAVIVPLVAVTVVLGLRDRRAAHRRIARWTVPLWLYVSVTGVLVYFAVHVWQGPPPAG